MRLGIFTAFDNYHKYYIRACDTLGVEYEIIDIISPDWLQNVQNSDCSGFLCRPPSKFQERKSMFDEKLYFVNQILKRPIYPSYDELYLYENKRMVSYWLDLHNIAHPETKVFYLKKDYLKYLENNDDYPIVIKSNIGSTSKGVMIVDNKRKAVKLANKFFGLIHPKLARGHTAVTTGKIIPFKSYGSREKHFIIVQKFEQIKWEWRIVKIDDSYFGHKKLLRGRFASGAHLKGWDRPPDQLLHLIKDICVRGGFLSMGADIFETEDGRFLVNELQSLTGQKTKHLMKVDDKPGRFVFRKGKFEFEAGSFNDHQSYVLRVKHFLKILEERKNNNQEYYEN